MSWHQYCWDCPRHSLCWRHFFSFIMRNGVFTYLPECPSPWTIVQCYWYRTPKALILKFLTIDITNREAKFLKSCSHHIHYLLKKLFMDSQLTHQHSIFIYLVKVWYEHDPEISVSPIVFTLTCSTYESFCFLKEWKHIPPAPSWISKVLPLLKVFTVPTKVQHPIQHAAK